MLGIIAFILLFLVGAAFGTVYIFSLYLMDEDISRSYPYPKYPPVYDDDPSRLKVSLPKSFSRN